VICDDPSVSTSDAALAAALATDAGRLLLEVRAELGYDDPRALKDAGDQRSHDFLMAKLAAKRPDDVVLSEEGADNPARLTAKRVWIVDPLDGTREFSEIGRTDWAVHVALWEDGELVAGAVALPAEDLTLANDPPPQLADPSAGPPRVLASRTRAPEVVGQVTEALGGRTVLMGSAGAKVMAVVRGEADVYVHGGGQYEWDSAAPVVVARAAGLHTSRLDGSPLRYNQENVSLPDLVVCRPELASAVLAVTRTVTS
jgi:3'(2'), 5'-bisphosphate nucleotidase